MQQRRRAGLFLATGAGIAALSGASPALAQTTEDLLRRIDALQRRVEELESARRTEPRTARTTAPPAVAPASRASRPAAPAAAPVVAAAAPPPQTPRVTREEVDEALRGSLPGSWRVPGTDTSVRLYGFGKASMWSGVNVRDRGDAPAVQGIPLAGSAADQQGGDLNFTARRSRIGFETHTPSEWGPILTRVELDFAGDLPSASGAATSSGYMPRLRHAFVEVGGDVFRVLVGQSNSLWNEGLIETLSDATFLNASAVRQAQIRLTGRLADGLTGQVSIEAPYTDYTSTAGTFYPDSTFDGGASPAFNQVPDLLGRLTYRGDFGEASLRGVVRQLKVETDGTAAAGAGSQSTIGWGFALNTNLALRNLWQGFGHDQLIGMAYYGEGIGRYFDSAYAGQGAYTNLGLPGATTSFSLDATPVWGFLVGYRLAWLTQLRSTFAYAYARQENPTYVSAFAQGSAAALAANREMQMAVANLIWSPFARETGGRLSNGWLDVGVEYIFFRRDIEGGAAAAGGALSGHGIEHRVQTSLIARF
ncbi:porin [Roseomonas sp. PWR1]|uniref:Porin n=1 Tax=Roseomonas nitratireducens TaxID=2820810 RepID=A0ABS4AQR5_9PROT|nr:porin [Neoroseomonas nitratireducens]MBP0463703.1 porin [Neoroseomonas nitratireducens]